MEQARRQSLERFWNNAINPLMSGSIIWTIEVIDHMCCVSAAQSTIPAREELKMLVEKRMYSAFADSIVCVKEANGAGFHPNVGYATY